MKKIVFALAFLVLSSSQAAFLELDSEQEFRDLVKTSNVPVVVQFSASWCNPCQMLKGVFQRVAPSYSESKVKLAYVDADQNPSLQKYLQGGYPTVRTFSHGSLMGQSFTGYQSESYVRNFINSVMQREASGEADFCPILN